MQKSRHQARRAKPDGRAHGRGSEGDPRYPAFAAHCGRCTRIGKGRRGWTRPGRSITWPNASPYYHPNSIHSTGTLVLRPPLRLVYSYSVRVARSPLSGGRTPPHTTRPKQTRLGLADHAHPHLHLHPHPITLTVSITRIFTPRHPHVRHSQLTHTLDLHLPC